MAGSTSCTDSPAIAMGFIARAFALLLGALALAEAGNTCTDYDGIGRNTCVAQGNSCEWCGTYYGGTKCSNSAWAGLPVMAVTW